MDHKAKLLRRLIALFSILVLLAGVSAAGLFSLQVINGEHYREQARNLMTSFSAMAASRGEIVDRYGRPLVKNQSVYSLRIDYAYWERDKQNDTILALVNLIRGAEIQENQSLPITLTAPFEYIGEEKDTDRSHLAAFAKEKKLGEALSAPDLIAKLREHYGIDAALPEEDARAVIGVRYEMEKVGFSNFSPFMIASNVSLDLISQIKERHTDFAGVNVDTESIRRYETTYMGHLLGRVGVIYKEEWDDYKAKGYSMNATVGKMGIESSFEQYLRGTDGTRSIETDISGKVTSVIEGKEPQPGNNVILALDLELQKVAEDSLAKTLGSISGAGGGAVVALDVNNGNVLAAASNPTIDLTHWELYNTWESDTENRPLINRAFQGVYAPGSTYKMLTAIAGLEEGVITETSKITCNRVYTRFKGYSYRCLGNHGPIDVLRATQKSCNIFFYETGHRLGGENLEKWAHAFGFGEKTGIEVSESAGSASGPENRKRMLERSPYLNPWQEPGGDVVTTAIGQSDNAMTPLQLANYTAAIANGGTLYKPTLLRSVKTYDYTGTVKPEQAEIIRKIDVSEKTLDIVRKGMAEVTDEGGTAARTFANYPIKVAGKSGTAQHNDKDSRGRARSDHAVFVAYAPYDNPQIAVAIVGEYAKHGSDVAPIARDIFDAYFAAGSGNVDRVDNENTLLR